MLGSFLLRLMRVKQPGSALVVVAVGLGLSAPLQAAPNGVPSALISGLAGGWNDNLMRIRLDGPFVNPQGCPMTDGSVTDPSQSGADLFHSMLLSAYMANKPVSLTIDGCLVDRPRIISVVIGSV